ncbi:arylesterase [Desulfovibrio ferrophilus]|nr:arylesterase [Desulfovibrio ferrophilus]
MNIISITRVAALLAAICILTAQPVLSWAADKATMKQTRQITLLAFGDSLTAGYGLPVDQSLPSQLEQLLLADQYNVRIINAGVSGDTTAGGLARLAWTLEEPVDAAILELGANDALMGQDPAAMERNLDAMLMMFDKKGIPVLLAGMRSIANYGEDYARAFDGVFPRLAGKHGTLFYPFLLDGVVMDPTMNQMDGIHPNARGAREIANRMYPLVRELVEQAYRN